MTRRGLKMLCLCSSERVSGHLSTQHSSQLSRVYLGVMEIRLIYYTRISDYVLSSEHHFSKQNNSLSDAPNGNSILIDLVEKCNPVEQGCF